MIAKYVVSKAGGGSMGSGVTRVDEQQTDESRKKKKKKRKKERKKRKEKREPMTCRPRSSRGKTSWVKYTREGGIIESRLILLNSETPWRDFDAYLLLDGSPTYSSFSSAATTYDTAQCFTLPLLDPSYC